MMCFYLITLPVSNTMYQLAAYRVASISAIEEDVKTKSESIKESLTRRMSALSASSLANLATGVGALSDIRHIHEKKSKERQTDQEIQEEQEKQEQDVKIEEENVEQAKEKQ